MRRQLARALHRLIALDHLADELGNSGFECLGIEKLRGGRVDGVEVIDVVAEGLAQLVDLAVAGAVADDHLHLEALLLRLAQEEGDVGVVAGVQQHVGTRALELGHQARKVGRGGRIAFLQHDVHAVLLALRLVARGDADAVRPVLVDDRHAHVLRLDVELGLGVVVDVVAGPGAELVTMPTGAVRHSTKPVSISRRAGFRCRDSARPARSLR